MKTVWALPTRLRVKATGALGTLSMIAYGALVEEQGTDDLLWIRLDTGETVKLPGKAVEHVERDDQTSHP